MTLRLTLACWDYDRTAALAGGTVTPRGIDLNYLALPVEETFFRMARFGEFDVAEMSLSSYVVTLTRERPLVAIPVFPSRAFRHNGVYVHAGSGIETPDDLRGRTIGVPEYQLTAAVWIRGILAEHHGVPVDSVRYLTGGLQTPGRVEKLALAPPGIEIAPIGDDQTLEAMLAEGAIDALYTPRLPRPFADGDERVRRLWPDVEAVESGYFAQTGIFPVMHVVAIRREVYERDRWIATELMHAFEQAKRLALERLTETAASANMLPWGYEQARSMHSAMGADPWAYGLDQNHETLATFLRYAHEQGIADRLLDPAELFAPEALERPVT